MAGELIRIHSPEEEYVHLMVTPCRSCGLGPLAPASIALVAAGGKPVDRVTVVCQKCGQKVEFNYDLSEFFGPQRSAPPGVFNPTSNPSTAVDLFGWVSLASLLASNCATEKNAPAARQMALEAQQCIVEALKFYASNSDTPPDSAFWTPEGQEDFAKNPGNYLKTALHEMRLSLPGTGSGSGILKIASTSGNVPATSADQPAPPKKTMMGFFKK